MNKLGACGLECRKRSHVFIERSKLIKESPMLEKYKLFVPKAWGNMDERSGYIGGSFSEIFGSKYGLDDREIRFIEEKVKEME